MASVLITALPAMVWRSTALWSWAGIGTNRAWLSRPHVTQPERVHPLGRDIGVVEHGLLREACRVHPARVGQVVVRADDADARAGERQPDRLDGGVTHRERSCTTGRPAPPGGCW